MIDPPGQWIQDHVSDPPTPEVSMFATVPPPESQTPVTRPGRPWIGVDLDGTLAHYDHWRGLDHIGEPVPAMIDRVRQWLAEGKEVRIFTARVSMLGPDGLQRDIARARLLIQAWCIEHIGQRLPVTNVKDYGMIELWDDRAVQVGKNTGIPVTTFCVANPGQ